MNRRRLLLVGLGLVVVALLVPLIQDVVRVGLVTPLLYLVWFGRLLFESVPQRAILIFLIVVAILLAWRSLVALPGPILAQRASERAPQGRVALWANVLHQAESDPYSAWVLAQRLAQLGQEVLAQEERLSLREVRQELVRGTLDVPPDVRAAIRAGIEAYRSPQRTSSLSRLMRVGRATNTSVANTTDVVAFLETRLREGSGGGRDT